MKTKLVYILPVSDEKTATHQYHLYGFLEELSKHVDLFLIIERGKTRSVFTYARYVYVQKFTFLPLRFLENIFLVLHARLTGYRNFYTHYSYIGALSAYFVTTLLGGRSFYWNCGMPWLFKRSFLREKIFRFILRHSILVTGTKSIASAYQEKYGLCEEKIHVVPNWIDTESFSKKLVPKDTARKQLSIPKDSKVVLFVHHLSERKGIDMIFPIARTAPDKNICYLVVGDGPEKKSLEEQKEKEKGVHVRIEGAVPNAQIPLYFSAASCFLMPSHEEGFPRVLLEAMCAGVPYVASDVGGVQDMSPQEMQTFIVSDTDVDAFARALTQILTQENVYGPILKRYVSRFDTKRVLPEFISLFEIGG